MNNYLSQTRHLPPNLQETVNTIINGILELASRVNSNMDSNSIGGILIYTINAITLAMPGIKPRTKGPKSEQRNRQKLRFNEYTKPGFEKK